MSVLNPKWITVSYARKLCGGYWLLMNSSEKGDVLMGIEKGPPDRLIEDGWNGMEEVDSEDSISTKSSGEDILILNTSVCIFAVILSASVACISSFHNLNNMLYFKSRVRTLRLKERSRLCRLSVIRKKLSSYQYRGALVDICNANVLKDMSSKRIEGYVSDEDYLNTSVVSRCSYSVEKIKEYSTSERSCPHLFNFFDQRWSSQTPKSISSNGRRLSLPLYLR